MTLASLGRGGRFEAKQPDGQLTVNLFSLKKGLNFGGRMICVCVCVAITELSLLMLSASLSHRTISQP